MATKKKTNDGGGLSLLELCNEALVCEREIKLLKDRQSKLEKEIKIIAKGDKESRVPTDGGGYSLQYGCSDGSFVKVTKYGDTLRAALASDSDELSVARELRAVRSTICSRRSSPIRWCRTSARRPSGSHRTTRGG